MQKIPRWPWWVSFVLVLAANYFLLNLLFPPEPARVPISYTYFKEQVVADNVAAINSRGDTIQGTFRQTVSYQPEGANSATNATAFSTV
jgi:cell division protease FtsH